MRLPAPPSLSDLQAHIPMIEPVPKGIRRPFWSVMIPTYNNDRYLERTLNSVLCQALGPEDMQIEVVDGGSTTGVSEQITNNLGRGRVTYHRLAQNRGAAHTFNKCIERSHGFWVHILHGDDMVFPGFYEAYAAAIRDNAQAQTVISQCVVVDENDRWTRVYGPRPPVGTGILTNFAQQQAIRQLMFFPAVVVRREAYEEIGGFCTLFGHVTDWDMWFRLAEHAPVACLPRPYAQYRSHGESDTNTLLVSASNIELSYFVVRTNLARLSAAGRTPPKQPWRSQLAAHAEVTAWQLDGHDCAEGRYQQMRWAWMLDPNMRRLVLLLKSWLKRALMGKTSLAPRRQRLSSTGCPGTN